MVELKPAILSDHSTWSKASKKLYAEVKKLLETFDFSQVDLSIPNVGLTKAAKAVYEQFCEVSPIPFRMIEFMAMVRNADDPHLVDHMFCPECGKHTKYSTANGFHQFCSVKCMANSPVTRKRRAEECFERTGYTSNFACPESRIKAAKTNLELYGDEIPSRTQAIKDKMKKTNLGRYGYASTGQVPEIKDKIKATHMKRRGVACPFSDPEVMEKCRNTWEKKHGVRHISQAESVKQKKRETFIRKYGKPSYFQTEEFKEKAKAAWLKNLGVDHPSKSEVVKKKKEQTMLERYGAKTPQQSPEIRNKTNQTNLGRYGSKSPFGNPEIQAKIAETNTKEYGSASPAKSPKVQSKRMETNLQHFGFRNPMQSPEIKQKAHNTKVKNGTFNSSTQEDNLYNALLNYFPQVIRQYIDKVRYQFACDFYIPSNDLFIEANFHNGVHGYEPFDKNNKDHVEKLKALKKAVKRYKTENPARAQFYRNCIDVWTRRDPIKLAAAKKHQLNYLPMYSPKEAYAWLDTLYPLSYYDNLNVTLTPDEAIQELCKFSVDANKKPRYKSPPLPYPSKLIAFFHQDTLFAQEEALWNNNCNDLQQKLIRSHVKHSDGRGFGQATTYELLTDGFSHYKRLTRAHEYYFNPEWLEKFVTQYNITSLCDPFGRYGETLLSTLAISENPVKLFIFNERDSVTYHNTKIMLQTLGLDATNNGSNLKIKLFNRAVSCNRNHPVDGLFSFLYNDWSVLDTKLLSSYLADVAPRYCAFILSDNVSSTTKHSLLRVLEKAKYTRDKKVTGADHQVLIFRS